MSYPVFEYLNLSYILQNLAGRPKAQEIARAHEHVAKMIEDRERIKAPAHQIGQRS